MSKLKELEAKVKSAAAPQRGEVLVGGIADELDQLTHDPVAIKALATELRGSSAALGAALTGGHSQAAPTTPPPHPSRTTAPTYEDHGPKKK